MIPKIYLSLLTFLLLFTGCGEAPDKPSTKASNETQDMLDAAESGDLDTVKKMLNAGAPVNGLGDDRSTALHFAAQEGHVDVAKLLIEKGADINAKDDIDQTPVDRARFWKQEKIIALLESSSIHEAAREGNLNTVIQQLNTGADVNHANENGDTPLTYAAFMGHLEIVDLLIEKGAQVNAKGLAGWTPLHLATQRGHKKITELLIEKGADINATTEDGFGGTPLDVAKDNLVDTIKQNGGKTVFEINN
jgi:ankyrin repeat protein